MKLIEAFRLNAQKTKAYIDQSITDLKSSVTIDYSNPVSTDYTNAVEAFDAGRTVWLKKNHIKIPMTGYDENHCFFGGTVSAYLPGGYVIAVYAHIGPNGQNYFWYQYNTAVEAAGLYSEDAGNYFTSNNVMGQLQEIGAKLAEIEASLNNNE